MGQRKTVIYKKEIFTRDSLGFYRLNIYQDYFYGKTTNFNVNHEYPPSLLKNKECSNFVVAFAFPVALTFVVVLTFTMAFAFIVALTFVVTLTIYFRCRHGVDFRSCTCGQH